MTEWNTKDLIEADKRFVWHPFTDMREWCAPEHEPLILVEGQGAMLRDSTGREYIDGNSSIWTNIHGHNHPHINAAIRRQLSRVAHTSFLGCTNPAAIEFAQGIVALFPDTPLTKVFFSDDGSTGIEVAIRVADQYWRLRRSRRYQFIAFEAAIMAILLVPPAWVLPRCSKPDRLGGTFLQSKSQISIPCRRLPQPR